MTTEADFTEEEWARLKRAPFVAGMAISLADPGGPIEAGLMHPKPAEVVAMREELRVQGHASGVGARVDAGHPSAYAVRIEDVVPGRIERVGEVHAPTVSAHLHHLRRPRQRELRGGRVRGPIDNPA